MSCPCGRPTVAEIQYGGGTAGCFVFPTPLVGVDFIHVGGLKCSWRPRYQGPHTARRIWRRD